MTSKLFLRKLFDYPNTLFRIIVYNPQNGKVRPITSLYKLLPVEEVVSSDVRIHQLEIAFSEPEEQALYEECPRMECCVYGSDDEVPGLEFIPDLTPEEKETQVLKADKALNQDVEVAIKQSLCNLPATEKHSTSFYTNIVTDKVTKLRDCGLDLIKEYIPDSPVYNPEDEPGQYNIPYVPHSPVYQPPSPEYTPSAITKIPGLDLLEEKNKEGAHIKFADPPASPQPNGDVSVNVSSSGPTQLQTASVHPTSDAAIILHPESSGPPQGMPIPVHVSKGVPPKLMSDTDLDEELQHPDHPIEYCTKEEGECTDEDDQNMLPLVDVSTDEAQTTECSPDPWNDSAFTLQERLDQSRWESLEPEPNYELYGVNRGDEQRQEILLEVGRIHRCVDQMNKMLQSISESQDNLKDFMIQRAEVMLKVNQISTCVKDVTH